MKSVKWPESLVDSVSAGICILNSGFRVELWNEFMETYTGILKEEIVGEPIGDFFPAFMEDRYVERIRLLFEGWPPLFFSSRLNNLFGQEGDDESDRKYQDVTVKSLHMNDNEEDCYALISVLDETDLNLKLEEGNQLYKQAKKEVERRQQAEKELLESEARLRQLNKTKDKLMSIIAHDLRSPLASNMSGMEVLCATYDQTPDENRKELLELLLDSTRQTYRLLEDLLTWSRLQAEEGDVFKAPFLVKQMIEYEMGKMASVISEKGIKVDVTGLEEVMVEADRNMMQVVFRNLVSNAVKFTSDGGSIRIFSRISDQMIHVSVRDSGVGMSQKRVRELFELNRLESTPGTRNEKGTGFGLVICKEFLEKNHGDMQVESVPGEGSTFTFSLPLFQNTAP